MSSEELSLSLSEDEYQNNPVFRPSSLPLLSIPETLLSEDSTDGYSSCSESESPSIPSTPTALSIPTEPMTPGTEMATEFDFCHLASPTSSASESPFVTPRKPRKKLMKNRPQQFQKSQSPVVRKQYDPPTITPSAKRTRVERPSSEVFSNVSFPAPERSFDIQVNVDGVLTTRELSNPRGNQIFNLDILSLVFSLCVCPNRVCLGRPRLYQQPRQDGLQSFYLLKCKDCHSVIATFPSSLCIGLSAADCINRKETIKNGQSEINTRSMLAVHTTSGSYQDFRLTCSLLDLHVPAFHMSKFQLNKIQKASIDTVQQSMKSCGKVSYTNSNSSPCPIPDVRECVVSFDASWHRRGHYSNQGFSAAIESESGKVLDYELYERNCYQCSKWPEERKKEYPDDYSHFWSKHQTNCTANYKGSSQSMESSAAVSIWNRSITNHYLAYGTYIGDGDSSSFKNVIASDPYKGALIVRKEECLGHAQKRVKKHLTKKGKDKKGIPERKADRIARLYALVVVQNRGKTALEIHNGLQVLLCHLDEKHGTCPSEENSWCYFQKRLFLHSSDPSNPPPIVRPSYLNPTEMERTRSVFQTFGSLSFCGNITLGKTQNSNESLHNMLWHNSPKAKHVGAKSLRASTALAVLSFNEGSLSYSAVLRELGIDASYSTMKFLSRKDHERNLARERRIKETQKRRRRQISSTTLFAEKSRRKRDKEVYKSGAYGSEIVSSDDQSDTVCEECHMRNCPIPRSRRAKKDQWVFCDDCERWYHQVCVGIKFKRAVPKEYFCKDCID